MREEIKLWWEQAQRDFESAEKNFDIGEFHICVFLCQQAVEKSLKALGIKNKGELIKIHSVIKLGKENSVPEKIISKLERLEPIYQKSRYPDVSEKVPFEEYSKKDAEEILEICQEVLEWIEKEMN